MRMHIELDDELVRAIDELSGPRGRTGFVRAAIRTALVQQRRRADLDAAAGALTAEGHDWDPDPAAWVRDQRRSDPRRNG